MVNGNRQEGNITVFLNLYYEIQEIDSLYINKIRLNIKKR